MYTDLRHNFTQDFATNRQNEYSCDDFDFHENNVQR